MHILILQIKPCYHGNFVLSLCALFPSSKTSKSQSAVGVELTSNYFLRFLGDLLGARPAMNLDRRSSHTGLPQRRPQSMKVNSPRIHSPGQPSSMLVVPQARQRGSSLPGNISINQDEMYRLRNFTLAGKKVINRGDSLKTRSNQSIASTNSR